MTEKIFHLLESFVHMNQQIIGWTGIAIVALVTFLLARMIFSKSADNSTSDQIPGDQLMRLEETLKKVVSEHNTASMLNKHGDDTQDKVSLESIEDIDAEVIPVSEDAADVEAVRLQLKKRDQEVKALKAEIAMLQAEQEKTGASEKDQGNSARYAKQVQDLEARLAEYEVIEDEIADLSHYKDENARLQKELEQLKKQVDQSLTDGQSQGESLVNEFESAVETQQPSENKTSEPDLSVMETPEESEEPSDSTDLKKIGEEFGDEMTTDEPVAETPDLDVAEAEKKEPAIANESDGESVADEEEQAPVMQEEEELQPLADVDLDNAFADLTGEAGPAAQSGTKEKVAQAGNADKQTKTDRVAEKKRNEQEEGEDDLLAEFTMSETEENDDIVDEPKVDVNANADELLGGINTEKMLNEMGDLSQATKEHDGSSALEGSFDVEQMAKEAKELEKESKG